MTDRPATSLEEFVHVGVDGNVSSLTVVPVANESTCKALLDMAGHLTARDGTILAVIVHTSEADSERAAEGDPVATQVQSLGEKDGRIELAVINASTVARGILDVARDRYADLILLGVTGRSSTPDGPLGPIARDVVTAAGCDVFMLKPAPGRITSIVAGSGQHAGAVATTLGDRLRVEVSTTSPGLGILSILHLLPATPDLPTGDTVLRVVEADPPGSSGWLPGPPARQALDADDQVLVVARHTDRSSAERLLRRVIPRLTVGEQERLRRTTVASARVSFDYALLCVVSSLLASFGLLADSAAVVIGAMLVAPLLGPLSAFGVGLATGDLAKMRTAARTTLVGAGIVFLTAYVVGLVTSGGEPTRELASRGAPTILDGGVALVSGVVGAYATARKDIPAALAGVAIAAALVPPVCSAAIGFADGHTVLGLGATLLFVTNIVCIAAIAALTFEVLGVKAEGEQPRIVRVATFLAVASVVIAVWVGGRTTQGIDENQVREALIQAVGEDASVVSLSISGGQSPTITAVVIDDDPASASMASIEEQMEAALGRELDLRVAILASE